MKKNLLMALMCSFAIVFQADAAFPVKKDIKTTQVTEDKDVSNANEHNFDLKETQTLSAKEQKKLDRKKAKLQKRLKKKEDKGGYGSLEELIILVLLWVFLGWLAGHRWYARKPVIWNIIYILTVGGFGIWALVDLIFILTGNFT